MVLQGLSRLSLCCCVHLGGVYTEGLYFPLCLDLERQAQLTFESPQTTQLTSTGDQTRHTRPLRDLGPYRIVGTR